MKKNVLLLCLFTLSSINAFSWGQIGHRVVGELAQRHLTEHAKQEIKKILEGESLATVSTWADEVRSNPKYHFLTPTHYTSIEDHNHYEYEREDDIVSTIEKIAFSLAGFYDMPELTKKEQVSLFVHLMGDLHQPLHVGRAADRGGNDIPVLWFGDKTNLHSVWDSKIIQNMELSYTEIVDRIDTPEFLDPSWLTGAYEFNALKVIMDESMEYRELIYNFGEQDLTSKKPAKLSYEYVYKTKDVVLKRLAQAGVRLASFLNEVFDKY